MKIAHTDEKSLLEGLIKAFNGCAEVAHDAGMRQKTLKGTRFYEGQAAAFRYVRDFLKDNLPSE
jgi:hypothetical protein